jgi:hypothetical protein
VIVCSIFFSCFNKFGNYAERGEPDKGHLATDIVSAYNLNVFRVINTIVTNDDYGAFSIKKWGVHLLSGRIQCFRFSGKQGIQLSGLLV